MDTMMDRLKPDEMQAMMGMMEDYLREAGDSPDPEKAPPHIKKLLEAIGAAPQQPQSSEGPQGQDITPSAGFVVKTADEAGRKVFINMCSSKHVPAPANWTYGQVSGEVHKAGVCTMRPTALGPAQQANNLVCRCQGGTALLLRDNLLSWVPDAQVPEEVRKALDAQNAAMSSEQVESALRIPLSCGEAREDMDRQGEACTVVDVVFNDDVLTQSRAFRPLKNFVISIAMSQTEQKCSLVLDKQWKLPKMRYKGDKIESQRIRVDSKARITELGDVQEEPEFPLRFDKRMAPAKPKPAQPGKPASAASPAIPVSGPAACQLTPTVQFIGRPVTSVSISVSLGRQQARCQISPDDVNAAVCNEDISLQVPGCKLVQVHLPFAVTASGADASISRDAQQLKLQLPLLSCRHMIEQVRQSMPQQLSSLGLASSSHLELEP